MFSAQILGNWTPVSSVSVRPDSPPIQTVSGSSRMYQPAQKPATKKLMKISTMNQIRPQKIHPMPPP